MKIIIGREEGGRRLHCVADGRSFYVGMAGSVPASVSRQHCALTVNGDTIAIENLKMKNVTYVDGNQIFSKVISAASNVQLGEERFTVPLKQILAMVTGGKQSAVTFSLRPLQHVWEEYDRRRMDISDEAAKAANRQRVPGIISMFGMCLGLIPGMPMELRICVVVAALALTVFFFMRTINNDSTQKKLHDLDEEFAKKYKCPNPECGRPFGPIPYRQIEYNKMCMSCGCKYTH